MDPSTLQATLMDLAGTLRGAQFWFHAAHHRTSGDGFAGDHKLFEDIYKTLEDQFDDVIERAIGLTGDDSAADPETLTLAANGFLQSLGQDPSWQSFPLAQQAHLVCQRVAQAVGSAVQALESSGQMTPGLNDLLPEIANKHESFCYHLGQRAKTATYHFFSDTLTQLLLRP